MDVTKVREELKQMAPEFAKRIQPIYPFLGWQWNTGVEPFVPQVSHILDTLLDMVEGIDEDFYSESTGGLEVFYTEPSKFDLCGCYGFRFVFEDKVIWGQDGKTRFVSVRDLGSE